MKPGPRSRTVPWITIFSLFLVVAGAEARPPAGLDSRAADLAARTMTAMGGAAAWQSTRLLRFDWEVEHDGETVVFYSHWWDRSTGDYRLEGKTREGADLRVLFNLESRAGEAWLGGEELSGDAAAEQIDSAYARFINDSYWLLMPWKWLDPGVVLTYEGEREADGHTYDIVRLEFGDGVGLTSGDRYWGWVDRDTGLMVRWEYVLQDEEGNPGIDEPTAWLWQEWVETDSGILLSTDKRRVGGDGDVRITFPLVQAAVDLTEAEISALLHPSL